MVDMIMTTKFPNAVVNKLIADIKDLMFIGAYIELKITLLYSISTKIHIHIFVM